VYLYTGTLTFFGVFRMWQQLNKLIIFNTKLVSEEYDSENSIFPLSQILLNSWNFKLDNKIDSQNFRQA
jgi:hypothetical protein